MARLKQATGLLATAGRQLVAQVASMYLGRLTSPNGAYHGASSRRQAMQAWRTTNASPDIDGLSNLETLRSRSRDLVRNVPSAKAALKKKSIHVVNTGIRFRSRLDHEALGITKKQARKYEKQITKVVHRWAKSKNSDATRTNTFYQNTLLVYHSMLESGDCFAFMPFLDRPNAYLDLAVKVVESDLCVPPTFADERNNAGGVELDSWGAPLGYWFKKNYVEDIDTGAPGDEPEFIPAFGGETGRPLVLHVYTTERPGQRRGIPLLAPVIEPLKQMGRYKDAELMAAVVSGMFTVFIETLSGQQSVGSIQGDEKAGDENDYEMSYGGVVNLAQDEKVTVADPGRPNPNFDSFTNSILREIGGALGIGAEMIQGYYSSSYNAARAAFLDAYAGFKVEIANIVSDFCEPCKDTVILNAVLRDKLDLPGYLDDPDIRQLWQDGVWVAPSFGQLDPLKETNARKIKVQQRFISRSQAVMESEGDDYGEVLEEIADEQERERELGVTPESNGNPAQVPGTGDQSQGAQPATTDSQITKETDKDASGK